MFRDSPECGPLRTDATPLDLLVERCRWRNDLERSRGRRSRLKHPEREAEDGLERITAALACDRIVFWAGTAPCEQLHIAMFAWFATQIGASPERFELVQIATPIVGVALLDEVKPHPLVQRLSDAHISTWAAACSADPNALPAFVRSLPSDQHLTRALWVFLKRRPSPVTGLGSIDTHLVRSATVDWQPAAAVVGQAMAASCKTGDIVGDVMLDHHLFGLSDPTLPMPPLERRGDTKHMRRYEVRLTDFGRACLAGAANHAEVNGVDEWIGGVHLTRG